MKFNDFVNPMLLNDFICNVYLEENGKIKPICKCHAYQLKNEYTYEIRNYNVIDVDMNNKKELCIYVNKDFETLKDYLLSYVIGDKK